MNRNFRKLGRSRAFRLCLVALVAGITIAALWRPFGSPTEAAAKRALEHIYRRPAPNFDLNANRALPNIREATSAQLNALNELKTAANAPNLTARWNDFGGSPDVMYDFASKPYSGTPEEAARAFINDNAGLFGVTELNNLRLFSQRQALGGHLLRFQQVCNVVPL